jgi:hypothetical protein
LQKQYFCVQKHEKEDIEAVEGHAEVLLLQVPLPNVNFDIFLHVLSQDAAEQE